jgi:hypothetical protein
LEIPYGHSLARKNSKVNLMSEVVPDTNQEFWRPPIAAQVVISSPAPALALSAIESCAVCQTEFMPGSHFCYLCGATRGIPATGKSRSGPRPPGFLRLLGFQQIKQGLGLPIPSLVGFFVGIACLVAALALGSVLRVQTATEFQAVQLLRIEWLLGSVAAFLAGILLRKQGSG